MFSGIVALILASTVVGQLSLSDRVDPISDHHVVYAIIGEGDVHLALGCSDATDRDTFRVGANFGRYIGDGGRDLIYRFDQRPPKSGYWYSRDREVYADSDTPKPIKFMLEMKGTTSLHLRTTTALGEQADMAFSYADPTAVIDDVLARCGFTPDGRKAKR